MHATLASAMHRQGISSENTVKEQRAEADYVLRNATLIFVLALRSQNNLFTLGLESEVDDCMKDVLEFMVT